jgi:PAS domain S-box-containing protein
MHLQKSQSVDASITEQPGVFAVSLFESDETLGILLEALAEGLIVIDQAGKIVLVNRRAEEMFGYRRDEMVGQPLSILLPERFMEIHTQHVAGFFQSPRQRPMGQGLELFARRKDGSEIPVDISLSHLQTAAGPLSLALLTDISRRKQAETELRERNAELDAYAHTVAHDLNAPLGTMIGFAESLVGTYEDLSPSELRKYLKTIAGTARRMGNTITELLLFASLRKADVQPETIDMAEIVGDAIGRLSLAIKEHQAEILIPETFPRALGYPAWVAEVWFNYVSNGLKYGGRPPRLELGGIVQDDGYAKFWVKDNGAGLTPEQQTQLFVPLARLEHTHKDGHGLGLSIVRRIVEKLGGQVGVESEPSQGSTFSFTLPVSRTGPAED